jgi:hypothetical protein
VTDAFGDVIFESSILCEKSAACGFDLALTAKVKTVNIKVIAISECIGSST